MRQELELTNALCALTKTRPGAIGARVTTSDNDHAPIMRVDVRFNASIVSELPVLQRQKIHCEMNPPEVPSGNVEITSSTRAGSHADCMEFRAQLFDCNLNAYVDT